MERFIFMVRFNSTGNILFCALFISLTITALEQSIKGQNTSNDAQLCHQASAKTENENPYKPPEIIVPDVKVVNQDEKPVNFYQDLIKDKIVVINFIYTNCKFICPPIGMNMGKLQSFLNQNGINNVHFIWVSRDPSNDTPQKLRVWREKFGKDQPWTLVTGTQSEIDKLTQALTGGIERPGDHGPLTLIGNDAHKKWIRVDGLAPSSKLSLVIKEVSEKP
jgi:protein SCO1